MKVVTAQEMLRVEKLGYELGAQPFQFMEAAGQGIAAYSQKMIARLHLFPKILILCGPGNNGGDAFYAGLILAQGGFDVMALCLAKPEEQSELCKKYSREFHLKGSPIKWLHEPEALDFQGVELIIDGLYGTGFKGVVNELYRSVIDQVNATGIPVLSVDVPSGINASTGEIGGVAIKAHTTLFLGFPKIGCFFDDAWDHTGEVAVHDFGLQAYPKAEVKANFELLELTFIKQILPKLSRRQHKYSAGCVVGFGGSDTYTGAPMLSSLAALRSGCGIVKLLHLPVSSWPSRPLEIVSHLYTQIEDVQPILEKADTLFLGPGLGLKKEAHDALKKIIAYSNKPMVIDADALTLISEQNLDIKPGSVLTPHMGELKRLLKIEEALGMHELLAKAQAFVTDRSIILVLKGSPTFVIHPLLPIHICTRGNPGMATAGSGDVLTGILAATIALTKDVFRGTLLGVYIHGLAGELAASKKTSYCLMASDIIEALPDAFRIVI